MLYCICVRRVPIPSSSQPPVDNIKDIVKIPERFQVVITLSSLRITKLQILLAGTQASFSFQIYITYNFRLRRVAEVIHLHHKNMLSTQTPQTENLQLKLYSALDYAFLFSRSGWFITTALASCTLKEYSTQILNLFRIIYLSDDEQLFKYKRIKYKLLKRFAHMYFFYELR